MSPSDKHVRQIDLNLFIDILPLFVILNLSNLTNKYLLLLTVYRKTKAELKILDH